MTAMLTCPMCKKKLPGMEKKCANCKIDFPDLDGGWVRADGTMAEVAKTLEEKYAGGRREWFGHPARTTPITVSAPGRDDHK